LSVPASLWMTVWLQLFLILWGLVFPRPLCQKGFLLSHRNGFQPEPYNRSSSLFGRGRRLEVLKVRTRPWRRRAGRGGANASPKGRQRRPDCRTLVEAQEDVVLRFTLSEVRHPRGRRAVDRTGAATLRAAAAHVLRQAQMRQGRASRGNCCDGIEVDVPSLAEGFCRRVP